MKYYIEALRADGTQILGNLDGQAVLDCQEPYRTKHVKSLLSSLGRPAWPSVARWRIVHANGRVDSEIANPMAAP
jgi:hypothetical protein